MKVTDERIIDITKQYVNNKLSLKDIAINNNIGVATVKKYIKYCEDIDSELYEKAYKKIQKNKTDKRDEKRLRFALQAFDNLKAKEIKKLDLMDWWIKKC